MLLRGIICCVVGCALAIWTVFRLRRSPNYISSGFGIELALLFVLGGAVDLLFAARDAGLADQEQVVNPISAVLLYGRFALYAILGVALLLNGLYVIRREGFSLAHALPLGWGTVLLFVAHWITFGPTMQDGIGGNETIDLAFKMLSMLVSYIPFALFGVWISNEICYRAPRPPEREYVVALGCGIRDDGSVTPLLRGRLDAAIAAYERGGQEAKIICSGGQGADEIVSEAQAMANYLVEQGVPERDVILEDKSTTTEENLRFSREIMEKRGGAAHCTIATNSYHCLRAAMFARRVGLRASCVGGRTAAFFYPAAFFREYIALVVRNRYAVAIFAGLTLVRFVLCLTNVLPEGLV